MLKHQSAYFQSDELIFSPLLLYTPNKPEQVSNVNATTYHKSMLSCVRMDVYVRTKNKSSAECCSVDLKVSCCGAEYKNSEIARLFGKE